MTNPYDIALLLSGGLTGSQARANGTYDKLESCKRLFNSAGIVLIPGHGRLNMSAGFLHNT